MTAVVLGEALAAAGVPPGVYGVVQVSGTWLSLCGGLPGRQLSKLAAPWCIPHGSVGTTGKKMSPAFLCLVSVFVVVVVSVFVVVCSQFVQS